MAKIFINNAGVNFLIFSNYKVMSGVLSEMLKENFPEIKVMMSIKNVNNLANYFKLAIVRNPYDRLLSLFYDKCRFNPRRLKDNCSISHLQKNQAQILTAYKSLNNLDINIIEAEVQIQPSTHQYYTLLENLTVLEQIDFVEFVKITEWIFLNCIPDAHFLPQSNIMTYNKILIVDKYYKIESLQNYWQEICMNLGKSIHLRHGKNRTNFEGINKYLRFYTVEMKKCVSLLYKDDFVNFNYDS